MRRSKRHLNKINYHTFNQSGLPSQNNDNYEEVDTAFPNSTPNSPNSTPGKCRENTAVHAPGTNNIVDLHSDSDSELLHELPYITSNIFEPCSDSDFSDNEGIVDKNVHVVQVHTDHTVCNDAQYLLGNPWIADDIGDNAIQCHTPHSISNNHTSPEYVANKNSPPRDASELDNETLINAMAAITVDLDNLKQSISVWVQFFSEQLEILGKSIKEHSHTNKPEDKLRTHTCEVSDEAPTETDWHEVKTKKKQRPTTTTQKYNSHAQEIPTRNYFKPLAFINNGGPQINYDDDAVSGIEKGIGPTQTCPSPVSTTKKSASTRPSVVVQHNPETNTVLSHRNISTVPGNSLYSNMAKNGKQIGIFGDSMVKRIMGKNISKDIECGMAKVRSFVGATASEVAHHIQPEIIKCNYDAVVICAGTNNIPSTKLLNSDTFIEQKPDEIAQEIINAGYSCRKHGINDIVISLLTVRRGFEEKVNQVNTLLKDYCRAAHFYFVEHPNILLKHLYDGLHIDTMYLHLYANNISNLLNSI